MTFIISLLLNALVLFVIAYLLPQVHIKNYGNAILVALLIGILNATIGMFLRFPLNLITLGLLTFVVRVVVAAIIIKLVDKMLSGFEVKGFGTALVLAIVMAITGSLLDTIF